MKLYQQDTKDREFRSRKIKNDFGIYFSDLCASKGIFTSLQLLEKLEGRSDHARTSDGLKSTCQRWLAGNTAPEKDIWPALIKVLKLTADERREFIKQCTAHRRNLRQKGAAHPDNAKAFVKNSPEKGKSEKRSRLKSGSIAALLLLGFVVTIAVVKYGNELKDIQRLVQATPNELCIVLFENRHLVESIDLETADQMKSSCEQSIGAGFVDARVLTLNALLEAKTATSVADFERAYELLLQAHNRRFVEATFELGNLYEDGMVATIENTVPDNFGMAAHFYKLASDLGLPEGDLCYAISLITERVYFDVEQSREELDRLLSRAAEHNNDAALLLRELQMPEIKETVFSECSSRRRTFPTSQEFPEWIKKAYGKDTD